MLVGIVEDIEMQENKAFATLDQLWTILNCGGKEEWKPASPSKMEKMAGTPKREKECGEFQGDKQ